MLDSASLARSRRSSRTTLCFLRSAHADGLWAHVVPAPEARLFWPDFFRVGTSLPATKCPLRSGKPFGERSAVGNRNLAMRLAGLVGALLVSACNPSPPPSSAASEGEGREFQGIWIATGTRQSIPFGTDRRASIANYSGTLMLSGAARPNVGFRA